MKKKLDDIKKLDIAECFADNCKNDSGGEFWQNYNTLKVEDIEANDFSIYYSSRYPDIRSLPDPDACSERLYEAHGLLWKKQKELSAFENVTDVDIYKKSIWLKEPSIELSSDSFVSIYWHWKSMKTVISKVQEDTNRIEKENDNLIEKLNKLVITDKCSDKEFSLYKKFIGHYLQYANTIGGFIVFPKISNSINVRRGNRYGSIKDRFDLTLECIRRLYQQEYFDDKKDNPLFGISKEEKAFFRMFGSFEKYTEFFCLNKSWVENGKVLNLLYDENKDKTERNVKTLDEWDFNQQKPLPQDPTEWWTFYDNIMSHLKARNQQIKEVIEGK